MIWWLCLLSIAQVTGLSAAITSTRDWGESYQLAEKTLKKLSKWQKSKLIRGVGWQGWQLTPGFYVGTITGTKSAGLPWLKMQDSGNGFRAMLQQTVGTTVVWPCPLALASTWSEEAVGAQARAIGAEFRGKSANVMLGPGLNVHRIARGGRNFEYLPGEDPYLGARLARSFVEGVQSQGVMAVLKHFGFNEQETHRDYVNSVVDDRTAWELYYQPFEAAIDAGAGAIMCSYNKVNNTPACGNHDLLTRDLREKMKFKGFVMSDWGATHSTALSAGLDMDMPGFDRFYSFQAVSGAKEQLPLNDSVRRILASMYHLRLDEGDAGCVPPMCMHQLAEELRTPKHVQLAEDIASKAVIMLKNERDVLPLNSSKVRKLGVIGSAADSSYQSLWKVMKGMPEGDVYSGGGSGHIHGSNHHLTTVLEAIVKRAKSEGVEVLSANTTFRHENTRPLGMLKMEADVLVVVCGLLTIESHDRPNLSLDPTDADLIKEASLAKPTIVLLMLPGAVLMPFRFQVSGILLQFYGGEASGHAFAAALFGDVNPSGKLPILIPENVEDTIPPSTGHWAIYSEGMLTSYRNQSRNRRAAYPFGHGLSYTTFQIRLLRMLVDQEAWSSHTLQTSSTPLGSPGQVGPTQDTLVSLEVRVDNQGKLPGAEVVQAYAQFPKDVRAPSLQLRGFRRTSILPPGGHEILYLHFNVRDFSCYSQQDGWRVQDEVLMHLGSSSLKLEKAISLNPQVKTSPGPWGTEVVPFAATTPKPSNPQVTTQPSPAAKAAPKPGPGLVGGAALGPAEKVTTSHAVLHDQSGQSERALPSEASDENNWILWALQPSLLLLLLLAAAICIRGESDLSDSEEDSKLPPELLDAEELPKWDYSYTGALGSEMSPLVDGPVLGRERWHAPL